MTDEQPRCPWAGNTPLMRAYHDEEWGVPLRDPRALFELLCLEGMQAGLSWRTVLERRAGYRDAFSGFDVATVAAMTDAAVEALLGDARLIRHRGKLTAIRDNARAVAAMADFAGMLWSFAPDRPRPVRHAPADVPATTPEAEALSRALRRAGLRFVGPTICYAFMQASGMVNDHIVGCFRHAEIEGSR